MLNAASPYIHPDFYNPLPSPTDATSSPLALLAKTCNSIGKDSPSSKPILQTVDKKENEQSNKSSSLSDKKLLVDESKDAKQEKDKPGFRTVNVKDDNKCLSDNHKTLDERKDIADSKMKNPKSSNHSSPSSSPVQTKITTSHLSPNSGSLASAIKPTSHPLYSGIPSSSLGYSGLSMLGHGINPELAAAYHQSQLLAQSGLYEHAALKAGATTTSMNPYVSYTRVRTPSGATTLVPVCKDPYCTNCQLTVRTSHTSSTCKTPGCAQCAHEKALLELSSSSIGLSTSPLSLYPHLASLPPSASGLHTLSSLHSLYPHSFLSSAAHQGLPYVCNWVSGHDYCGKRFNSSEELMQHLRSHTSSIDSGLPTGHGFGLPPGLSAIPGLSLGSAPISPDSIRRAYPTSLSPGLLSTNRFHPYKSSLSGVTSSTPVSNLSPLGAYYPYSLYAQRLGAVP